MIEKIVCDYLNTALEPVHAYMETPEAIPEKYVIIEKTGSGIQNHIKSARIAIQSISGRSLYEAAALNESVKTAMDSIIAQEDISKSELNSDYNFTNPETKEYRYQAVYDLVY